jgi:IS4 transposase
LLAGRLTEVQVTDRFVGEDWRRFDLQDGDLVVSDAINGYQEHIVDALDKQAHVVVRFSPKTLPLYNEQGQRIEVLKWLRGRRAPAGRICSQNVWLHAADGSKRMVRLVALRLTQAQTQASQRRKKKKAGQDKRTLQADTLYFAGWLLLVTSLPAQEWSDAEVLALYRARWHIELLFKRLKQLLDTHRLRCENEQSIRASLLLFLLTWVLQEDESVQARLCLQEMQDELLDPAQGYAQPQPHQGQEHAISEWMLAGLSLDLLRQQVHGQISAARFRACLPRLQRFVRGSPRQRTHWYSQVCNWLRSPAA